MPSHQTSPSSVRATLVKMMFSFSVAMALKLVFSLVPGATPKKPASGLMAYRRPVLAGLDPGDVVADGGDLPAAEAFGGISMAKLVLPQADGKAAAT
jgi:hypothetical protein